MDTTAHRMMVSPGVEVRFEHRFTGPWGVPTTVATWDDRGGEVLMTAVKKFVHDSHSWPTARIEALKHLESKGAIFPTSVFVTLQENEPSFREWDLSPTDAVTKLIQRPLGDWWVEYGMAVVEQCVVPTSIIPATALFTHGRELRYIPDTMVVQDVTYLDVQIGPHHERYCVVRHVEDEPSWKAARRALLTRLFQFRDVERAERKMRWAAWRRWEASMVRDDEAWADEPLSTSSLIYLMVDAGLEPVGNSDRVWRLPADHPIARTSKHDVLLRVIEYAGGTSVFLSTSYGLNVELTADALDGLLMMTPGRD